jgi:predicted alpha/beta hydrolase family esterase
MKECKVIFVHGIGGSTKSNFVPLLNNLFEQLHLDYDISNYDGGVLNLFPKAKNWVNKLDSIVRNTTKPIVLVGYSLGARTVLMYLEENDIKVDTVILIAAPPNSTLVGKVAKQGRVATFFSKKLNPATINSRANRIIQIHDTDDTKVPYFMGKMLSEELHSDFRTVKGYGHFMSFKSYCLIAPLILEVIK